MEEKKEEVVKEIKILKKMWNAENKEFFSLSENENIGGVEEKKIDIDIKI